MYGGAGFAVGLDAITAGFKEGEPTTIHWSTERSFVASSGDLGVSIGTIRSNDPKQGRTSPSSPSGAATGRTSPGATSRNRPPSHHQQTGLGSGQTSNQMRLESHA